MKRERRHTVAASRAFALVILATFLAGCDRGGGEEVVLGEPDDYEVWVVDQSDSQDADFGGMLYVFDAEDLIGPEPSAAQAYDRVDLAGATSTLCVERTGVNPVRPHMLLFNNAFTHAVISFVASGHVVIMDAATREPLDCFRTSQSATGQQAHAAVPAPDGSYILVANQSGKRLERIDTDYRTGSFRLREDAVLDLATCTTPSGAPCESPDLRPLNWPICPIVDRTGGRAFVTLRGGGMLVVDPKQTPMTIVGEYDRSAVRGNGCGGVQVGDHMYVSSGGSPVDVSREDPEHPSLYGFEVYRFPLDGFSRASRPNTPVPETVYSKPGAADAHGMAATADGRYLWIFDRHNGVAEVIDTRNRAHVGTVPLTGDLSLDPAPDLVDVAPTGDLLFVALRGPTPLSGDPHNSRGSTPGLGIVALTDGGRAGALTAVVPVTNVGADGVERADVHAVRVRRR